MIKKLVKYFFFPDEKKQRIFSGPAKGMYVKYNRDHRLQHLSGLYEREIYYYLKKGMHNAEVLIDIGANDGYYVMAFLRTGKKVIACEPGSIVNELIVNAVLNGFEAGENYILETRLIGNTLSPEFISISDLTEGITRPCFILVDIDGGERDLLDSCGSAFQHKGMKWLVETHSKELENECLAFFKENNYATSIIKNAWWRAFIPEQRPLGQNRWLYAEQLD